MLNYYSLMMQLEILSSRFTHKSLKRETPSLISFSDTIADRKGFRKKRIRLLPTLFVCIFKEDCFIAKNQWYLHPSGDLASHVLLKSDWAGSVDFEELCRQIGESPVTMENMLYEQFGMSAKELIAELEMHGKPLKWTAVV